MANASESKANRYSKALYFSIALFCVVLIITLWFFFYNMKLNSKIEKLSSDINDVSNSLSELKSNDKVELYTLLKSNMNFLSEYEKLSKIPVFIENLKGLSRDYNITFSDFSYSDSLVSSICSIENTDISLASDRLNNFLWDFRDENNKNIFSLNFISEFKWQDTITFTPEFKIK